jgi:hypothetical protein
MMKGQASSAGYTMSKMMFLIVTIVTLIISIIAVITLTDFFKLPCWRDVKGGFSPLLMAQLTDKPKMILDGECVKHVVFTNDRAVCDLACNLHTAREPGEISKCAAKCWSEDIPEDHAFIVVIPRTYTNLQKLIRARGDAGISSLLLNGKPQVYTLECKLYNFRTEDARCDTYIRSEGSWRCSIEDKCKSEDNQNELDECEVTTHYLNILSGGTSCDICTSRFEDGGCNIHVQTGLV